MRTWTAGIPGSILLPDADAGVIRAASSPLGPTAR
jgi:hypothetical protein